MGLDLILKALPWVMNLLKGLGVVKNPEEEKAYRLKLLELAAQKDLAASQEFIEFLKATSPQSADTPRWINGLTAATRPLITWMVLGSIVYAFVMPGVAERITITLKAFEAAGTAGLMFLAIPLFWFLGRSVEKLFPWARFVGGGNGNGGHDGELGDNSNGRSPSNPPRSAAFSRPGTRPPLEQPRPPMEQPAEGSPIQ